jgi:hypothetical protein
MDRQRLLFLSSLESSLFASVYECEFIEVISAK